MHALGVAEHLRSCGPLPLPHPPWDSDVTVAVSLALLMFSALALGPVIWVHAPPRLPLLGARVRETALPSKAAPILPSTDTNLSRIGVVIANGPAGSPDSVWARDPSVLIDEQGTYRMWYRGSDGLRWRILYATSSDGIVWTKGGVAIDSFATMGAPFVLREGSTYQMWFQGGPDGGGAIFHTSSIDGRVWSAPAVALGAGASGSWDAAGVNTPWVVKTPTRYLLFYMGSDGSTERIGVAASTNYTGFSALSGSPAVDYGPSGAWDNTHVRFPAVLPGAPWTMYYAGYNGSFWSIGIARSDDALNWTKAPGNPILSPSPYPSWDFGGIVGGFPLSLSSGFRFYYSGSDQSHVQIGLAMRPGTSSGAPSAAYDTRTVAIVTASIILAPIAVLAAIFLLPEMRRRNPGSPPSGQ